MFDSPKWLVATINIMAVCQLIVGEQVGRRGGAREGSSEGEAAQPPLRSDGWPAPAELLAVPCRLTHCTPPFSFLPAGV